MFPCDVKKQELRFYLSLNLKFLEKISLPGWQHYQKCIKRRFLWLLVIKRI